MTRLLEGTVLEPMEEDRIVALAAEIRDLRAELAEARANEARARKDAARALSSLRHQLSPLYRALQMVFGELDAAGVQDEASRPGTTESIEPRVAAVWQSWKSKLPGKASEFIDILLQHGEMNAAQLRIAGRCSSDTVYQTIHKLNKAGLINKNGGKFSLKQL